MEKKLSRIGNPWSSEEEEKLLNELQNNITINNISQNHQRTMTGIISRIKQIALKMYNSGTDIGEIIEATKLSHNEIKIIIEKHSSQNERTRSKNIDEPDIKYIKDDLSKINRNIEKLIEINLKTNTIQRVCIII
jgi:hypothetical protein